MTVKHQSLQLPRGEHGGGGDIGNGGDDGGGDRWRWQQWYYNYNGGEGGNALHDGGRGCVNAGGVVGVGNGEGGRGGGDVTRRSEGGRRGQRWGLTKMQDTGKLPGNTASGPGKPRATFPHVLLNNDQVQGKTGSKARENDTGSGALVDNISVDCSLSPLKKNHLTFCPTQ